MQATKPSKNGFKRGNNVFTQRLLPTNHSQNTLLSTLTLPHLSLPYLFLYPKHNPFTTINYLPINYLPSTVHPINCRANVRQQTYLQTYLTILMKEQTQQTSPTLDLHALVKQTYRVSPYRPTKSLFVTARVCAEHFDEEHSCTTYFATIGLGKTKYTLEQEWHPFSPMLIKLLQTKYIHKQPYSRYRYWRRNG